MYEWRTMLSHHWARDEVLIHLALRDGSQFSIAKPCPIVLEAHEVGEAVGDPEEPFLRLPRESLDALFDCLARELFGADAAQLRNELEATRRKLQTAESRLDRLIDGLAAAARATGPGGTHHPPKEARPGA